MKKKILALAMCVALLAIAIVGGTLAYFSDSDEATNTFTVGNVKIDLTEPNWEGSGSVDAPELYAGEALAKDPTVENVGKNPCFVRIQVPGLDCLDKNDPDMLIHIRNANYVLDAVNADWEVKGDYIYYKHVLAVGDTTATPAFSAVVMPTALENGDGTTEFDIDVVAEAVQAQGAKPSWSAVQTMTVDEIAAWFTTCGM